MLQKSVVSALRSAQATPDVYRRWPLRLNLPAAARRRRSQQAQQLWPHPFSSWAQRLGIQLGSPSDLPGAA